MFPTPQKGGVAYGLYNLLPSFIGMYASAAEAKAKSLGLSVIFIGEEGKVKEQNYPANKRMDKIGGPLYLTLSGPPKVETPEVVEPGTGEGTGDATGGENTTPETPTTTPTDPTPSTPTPDNSGENTNGAS